jgi:GDP-D-mannose dehydratase
VDVLRECEPQEIYNLAAMSFVAASWSQPVLASGILFNHESERRGRHLGGKRDARLRSPCPGR